MIPCPRSRLSIWSRETGSAVPSRISLLISILQAESSACLRDSSRFPRRRPFIIGTHYVLWMQQYIYVIYYARLYWQHCHHAPSVRPMSARAQSKSAKGRPGNIMNPALSEEFNIFCEQDQLQKHATVDRNPYYCAYDALKNSAYKSS